jgi:hypothetical protein
LILRPGEQQEQAKQRGDADRDEKQGSDIKRCRRRGDVDRHIPTLHLPVQVCTTSRHWALDVCAKGFAKRLAHDADFEKNFRKSTENASKLFVD